MQYIVKENNYCTIMNALLPMNEVSIVSYATDYYGNAVLQCSVVCAKNVKSSNLSCSAI